MSEYNLQRYCGICPSLGTCLTFRFKVQSACTYLVQQNSVRLPTFRKLSSNLSTPEIPRNRSSNEEFSLNSSAAFRFSIGEHWATKFSHRAFQQCHQAALFDLMDTICQLILKHHLLSICDQKRMNDLGGTAHIYYRKLQSQAQNNPNQFQLSKYNSNQYINFE